MGWTQYGEAFRSFNYHLKFSFQTFHICRNIGVKLVGPMLKDKGERVPTWRCSELCAPICKL